VYCVGVGGHKTGVCCRACVTHSWLLSSLRCVAVCVDKGSTVWGCQGVSSKQWELGSVGGWGEGVADTATALHWRVCCRQGIGKVL
jgi:hypothetical protein